MCREHLEAILDSMSLAGRRSHNKAQLDNFPDNTLSKPKTVFEGPLPPPTHALINQFSGLALALMLAYLRKSSSPVFGWTLGLIVGIIPAECVVLSLFILEVAWRELNNLFGSSELEKGSKKETDGLKKSLRVSFRAGLLNCIILRKYAGEKPQRDVFVPETKHNTGGLYLQSTNTKALK
jgi:hypothetical protein